MFFKEIEKYLAGFDVKISLQKSGEMITVGIFPTHKNTEITAKLKPVLVTGTADELDADLFNKIGAPLETAVGLAVSIEGYNVELKKLEGEKKTKLEEKQKAPEKKEVVKKPAAKKVVKAKSKPAAKKAPATSKKKSASVEKNEPGAVENLIEKLLKDGNIAGATKMVNKVEKGETISKDRIEALRKMIEKSTPKQDAEEHKVEPIAVNESEAALTQEPAEVKEPGAIF